MKRLIASDYDGTLSIHDQVSPENRAAIARWRAAGGLFGVVTGRGRTFPQRIAAQGVRCDYFVCYNGALLLDGDGRVLRDERMSREAYCRLEAAFAERPDALHYNRVGDDPSDSFSQYTALMPTCEAAAEFVDELNHRFGDEVSAYANGLNINIVKKGESKTEGVRHTLRHFGLPESAAAVVGDDLNDLDLLLSLHGWAMRSGRPRVVAAAEHHCDSVAELIDQLERLNRAEEGA